MMFKSMFSKFKVLHNSKNLKKNLLNQNVFINAECISNYVLESPFGPVDIPNQTLTNYVFKNIDKSLLDYPMITCGLSERSYNYDVGRFGITQFAIALLNDLKMEKGEVLGILLPNVPEFIFALHGALEAGLVVTFANPLYTPEEIERQFKHADVKCVITIQNFLKTVTEVVRPPKGTIVLGESVEEDISNKIFDFKRIIFSQPPDFKLPEVSPNDLALLPYSSGTTGLPKGVMLSHRNLTVNLEQCLHPEIRNNILHTSLDSQERIFSILPFFHIYGLNSILHLSLMHGTHLITLPIFTPESFIKCLRTYKPTIIFVIPSLMNFLSSHPNITPEILASIKEINCGGAPATKSMIENLKEKFKRKDFIFRQGYGMTETSPVVLLTRNDIPKSKIESTGQLVRGTQAKIINIITKDTLPKNETGELCLKGPQIMLGYLKDKPSTNKIIDSEGWLHTGDIAYYDKDGYFYIVDRIKELIKVQGYQVSPTELENIIHKIPGVIDAAVVGIPNAKSGEVPKAFVVKQKDSNLIPQDIADFVAEKVAKFKKLEGGVEFINQIPKTPAGKIMRKTLIKQSLKKSL